MTAADEPAVSEKALTRRVKDHVTGSRHDFFAIVQPGFEEIARQELRNLGIADFKEEQTGGLAFAAKLSNAMRVNLGAGTVNRLLLRLFACKATGFAEFRRKLTAFPWELYLSDGARIHFSVSSARSRLWSGNKLQEEAAKAISARLTVFKRTVVFMENAVAKNAGQQLIFIRFSQNRCQVSLDSSGELLYQRGYGKYVEQAPLRETLACCVLRAAAVDRYRILIDPFCGSGTLALEAGLIFSGRPCNFNRDFAFQNWPCFKLAAYRHLRERLLAEMKNRLPAVEKKIYCSDISAKAVQTAARNLQVMGLESLLEVRQADFFKLQPPATAPADVLLVLNPPYGMRLSKQTDISGLYRRIGAKIRRDYAGCGYAIIVPGLDLEKTLSLSYDKKILFRNGGIPVSLLVHQSK